MFWCLFFHFDVGRYEINASYTLSVTRSFFVFFFLVSWVSTGLAQHQRAQIAWAFNWFNRPTAIPSSMARSLTTYSCFTLVIRGINLKKKLTNTVNRTQSWPRSWRKDGWGRVGCEPVAICYAMLRHDASLLQKLLEFHTMHRTSPTCWLMPILIAAEFTGHRVNYIGSTSSNNKPS